MEEEAGSTLRPAEKDLGTMLGVYRSHVMEGQYIFLSYKSGKGKGESYLRLKKQFIAFSLFSKVPFFNPATIVSEQFLFLPVPPQGSFFKRYNISFCTLF